jgi:DNA-binding transcriptional regulator YdaS (Cro superfamily)
MIAQRIASALRLMADKIDPPAAVAHRVRASGARPVPLMPPAEHAIRLAIHKAGGATKLAKAIGGITSQAVSQWKICPASRAIAVESASGVSRHDLRPDVFGMAPQEVAA